MVAFRRENMFQTEALPEVTVAEAEMSSLKWIQE